MAKRFTDTEKWKKPFIKGLPIEYKLLWFYILDDCDIAGIWHVDIEVAEIRLGIKLSAQKAVELLKDKIIVFDDGTKWFISDFITFQYGLLTPKNKLYNSITSTLHKYNLMGHLSPINGVKDKDKDKDKDKEKDKEVVGENEKEDIPFQEFSENEIEALKKIKEIKTSQQWQEQISIQCKIPLAETQSYLHEFLEILRLKDDLHKELKEIKSHFVSWLRKELEKKKNNPTVSQKNKMVY